MLNCVALSKVFCNANLRCSLKGTNLTFTKSFSLAMGNPSPRKTPKINEKHKRHANLCCSLKRNKSTFTKSCHMQLGEPNPRKTHKKKKNKKICKLVLLFQECFGNLISQKMRFSSLFTQIIPIKNKLEPNSL